MSAILDAFKNFDFSSIITMLTDLFNKLFGLLPLN